MGGPEFVRQVCERAGYRVCGPVGETYAEVTGKGDWQALAREFRRAVLDSCYLTHYTIIYRDGVTRVRIAHDIGLAPERMLVLPRARTIIRTW